MENNVIIFHSWKIVLQMNWHPKLAWVLYFIIFQFLDDVQDQHYESAMIGRPVYVLVSQSTDWSTGM
jgi:hypothetical protein